MDWRQKSAVRQGRKICYTMGMRTTRDKTSADARIKQSRRCAAFAVALLAVCGSTFAFEATFENGLLISADVYTVTVGVSRSSRVQVPAEEWFFRWLAARGESADRVSLVYRADFLSDSVGAEWGARRSADDGN